MFLPDIFQAACYPGCKNGDCRRPWVIKVKKKLCCYQNIFSRQHLLLCFCFCLFPFIASRFWAQECNCQQGWGGFLCDEALNYCQLNPDTCKNGGKCSSLTQEDGFYKCECPAGYKGERCDRTNMTLTSISRVEVITPLPMTQTSSQKPLLSERNATTPIAISTSTMETTRALNNDDNET